MIYLCAQADYVEAEEIVDIDCVGAHGLLDGGTLVSTVLFLRCRATAKATITIRSITTTPMIINNCLYQSQRLKVNRAR